MEKLTEILIKIFFPHIAIVILLVPVSTALLIYAFAVPDADEIVSYISYFISSYTLTVVCAKSPEIYGQIKAFKAENKYINMYASDAQLRVKISLYTSVFLNTAYAAFQLVLGIYHASVWFYSLAVYYIMLVIMRSFLLHDLKHLAQGEDIKKELSRYRFCGIIILCMNLALAVIVFYIAWQNRGFVHHPITTIAMAAYTFTALTMAIVNTIKYKKYKSPILSASKAISLVSATVSVLTLETAMLTAFGEENSPLFGQIMTASTGAAVCVFVLVVAIYMIVKSTKELTFLKQNNSNSKTND